MFLRTITSLEFFNCSYEASTLRCACARYFFYNNYDHYVTLLAGHVRRPIHDYLIVQRSQHSMYRVQCRQRPYSVLPTFLVARHVLARVNVNSRYFFRIIRFDISKNFCRTDSHCVRPKSKKRSVKAKIVFISQPIVLWARAVNPPA